MKIWVATWTDEINDEFCTEYFDVDISSRSIFKYYERKKLECNKTVAGKANWYMMFNDGTRVQLKKVRVHATVDEGEMDAWTKS